MTPLGQGRIYICRLVGRAVCFGQFVGQVVLHMLLRIFVGMLQAFSCKVLAAFHADILCRSLLEIWLESRLCAAQAVLKSISRSQIPNGFA